ncbi:unnamed protein product [Xylocopa violacea]|uniref:Uncharacterized protein n=1 Tax=Xylocopa violacea TaxID=135666 RepID=A0ABP1N3E4_XYLVO
MAYVLWRVFMKKYSKVRLGLRNLPVIPAERRGPEKEETWTLAPDHHDPCVFFDDIPDAKPKPPHDADNAQSRIATDTGEASEHSGTLPRTQETRKSKTKKVKSYLRKCKGALSKADEAPSEKKRQEHCTSWYLDESHQEDVEALLEKQSEFLDERLAEAEETSSLVPDEAEENATRPVDSLEDQTKPEDRDEPGDEALARLAEDEQKSDLRRSRTSLYEDARDSMNDRECVVEETCASKPQSSDAVSVETLTTEDTNLNKCDSNDTLIAEVANSGPDVATSADADEGKEEETRDLEADNETVTALTLVGGRGDVASLVRNLLGPIYGDGVIDLLIRQARDILVCAYHGNLENFLKTYLSPAASLLAEVKSVATETLSFKQLEASIDEKSMDRWISFAAQFQDPIS